jgi:uncharacterized protein (DUF433 family)
MDAKPFIQPNGRISGTRIGIYDVFDYYKNGWTAERIAPEYSLSVEQVAAAIDYIDANRDEVARQHEAFKHRTNPPEVQARIDAGAPVVKARIAEMRRRIRERNHALAPRVAG